MRICRFDDDRIGIVEGATVRDVTAALEALPPVRYPYPRGDRLIASLEALRAPMARLAEAAPPIPLADVRLKSPVANPTKIVGVPQNYEAHAREATADVQISQGAKRRSMADQGLFLKAVSALVGPSEGVAVRFPDRRTDHEAELGVVIGKRGSDIPRAAALGHVAGYAIAMDMVVRGPEDRSFRKSVDSYAVLGPWLVTADEIPDPSGLSFTLSVDGKTRQKANTADMILDVPGAIAWASRFYTLYPGDIIMSGTCEGVARVFPGDVIHLVFERIGEMDVAVRVGA